MFQAVQEVSIYQFALLKTTETDVHVWCLPAQPLQPAPSRQCTSLLLQPIRHPETTKKKQAAMATVTPRVLFNTALACAAGTGVVGGVAQFVLATNPAPEFSLDGPRFDLSTFRGRWKDMMVKVDPSSLFASRARVMESRSLLQKYASGDRTGPCADDAALWEARLLRDASFGSAPANPDAEIVPHFFRMAGYVPFNAPICVAMMTMTKSNAAIIFPTQILGIICIALDIYNLKIFKKIFYFFK